MADKMNFALVSPERQLAAGEADLVTVPGMAGDMGVMTGHTPVLTTLRPGFVTVANGSDTQEFFVTGGFVEVTAESVVVLAEESMERSALRRQDIDDRIAAARAELEEIDTNDHHGQQSMSQRINDLLHAGDHVS